MTLEQKARVSIDMLLATVGWHVCTVFSANLHAATGLAIREFPLNNGFGFADYLLYVNGKACGVIEAKKEGATLTGVEVQSGRYAQNLPNNLPAWRRPLPFHWQRRFHHDMSVNFLLGQIYSTHQLFFGKIHLIPLPVFDVVASTRLQVRSLRHGAFICTQMFKVLGRWSPHRCIALIATILRVKDTNLPVLR